MSEDDDAARRLRVAIFTYPWRTNVSEEANPDRDEADRIVYATDLRYLDFTQIHEVREWAEELVEKVVRDKREKSAAFRARVAELLREIEWNGQARIGDEDFDRGCPSCRRGEGAHPQGHEPSCALAALLKECDPSP